MDRQYSMAHGSKRHNAGLYIRLSVEDSSNSAKQGKMNPFQSESASVENQRAILMEYVLLQGWNFVREYVDDGYTGGNFQRPAFQDMLEDAKAGLIDLILVKDLSRLGRDHIEVDNYVEEVFPGLGVRFIALMDSIDSEGGSDILPFRSIMNNYYLKDLSRKIKSSLRAKAEAGEYVGTFAPYGYKKDPANCGRLIVDPYAAEVVRRIFEMRLQKMGYCRIAAALNTDGILAPRAYCYASEGKENPYKTSSAWSDNTVKVLLHNEEYLGHSVKLRHRSISYKKQGFTRRPEEEWARVENTHEAIISQEVWDAVREVSLIRYDPAKRKPPTISLFSNLLYCADCGSSMAGCFLTSNRKSGKVKVRYYSCRRHRRTGRTECSWHTISEEALLQLLREDMRRHMEKAGAHEDAALGLARSGSREISADMLEKELRQVSDELEALGVKSARLYEDRLSGGISLDAFMAMSVSLDEKRGVIQAEHDRLSESIRSAQAQLQDTGRWLEKIRFCLTLDEPDFDSLHDLIERIEVSEAEGAGKNRRQAIKIIYRFVGFTE